MKRRYLGRDYLATGVVSSVGGRDLDHGSDDGDQRRDQYAGAARGFRCFHLRAVDVSG
jgi:hypothetical protein